MTNIKKSPKLTLIFRYFVLLLLIFLLSVPLAFTAREECKDSTDLAAVLPESVCTYLIENKPVSASTLLSLTQLFTLIILASNWNLTGGITGYIDFGHSVFFGMGAFATALLMGSSRWEEWPAIISDWNFWPAMIVGALISSFLALLIGAATLRLKGPYFSIAMLGTFVAVREIIRVSSTIAGGGLGMNLPIILNRPFFYYFSLIMAVGVLILMWWIRRSEFGATLVAIREDEIGAEMRGINTTLHKITAFWIAAFLTAMVGGMWAYQNTFIDPDIVFNTTRNVDMVMMSMLGGLGTVAGPLIGATTLYYLRDFVWANSLLYHQIFEGILLIIIVLFVPDGIMGMFDKENNGTNLNKLFTKWFPKKDQEDGAQ